MFFLFLSHIMYRQGSPRQSTPTIRAFWLPPVLPAAPPPRFIPFLPFRVTALILMSLSLCLRRSRLYTQPVSWQLPSQLLSRAEKDPQPVPWVG